MVHVVALWLPIVLSAVIVFVASSIIHMFLRYHRHDFAELPDTEATRAALGKQKLAPGQYVMPYCKDMKDMKTPEMIQKYTEGPVAFITVLPNGQVRLGKHLIQWFLFSLGISFFVAYILGRTIPAGASYMLIFRVATTAAWLGYAGGVVWAGIWKGVPWSKVWVDVFDGFIYALLTAGAFACFYPET